MNKKTLLSVLGIYLITTAVSFGAFSQMKSSALVDESNQVEEETEEGSGALLDLAGASKDQVCPLSGEMFTKVEKDAWSKRRPLAVMIENSPDARPQSGLGSADLVFEAMAEGGVTRFMAMYYCRAQHYDVTVAPVRSARTYFVDWASGFNLPMYVHVGGANTPGPANALGQISDYGWALENDINQFSVGYPTFIRNAARLGREVATEHTMETTTEKLWEVAADREWTNITPSRKEAGKVIPAEDWSEGYTPWSFQDGTANSGAVKEFSYDFWTGYNQFSVKWTYDADTNSYRRFLAGESHIDLNTDKQIQSSNVIVLLTDEKGPIDELKHMLYKTTGVGNALVFQNGDAIEAKWSKPTRTAELKFTDAKGSPLSLVRGQTWISVVSADTKVEY